MNKTSEYLAWGSHILLPCLHYVKGPVLEIGAGYFSTMVLALYSQSRYYRTIETNRDWHDKIKTVIPVFREENHEIVYAPKVGHSQIADRHWGVALVDQTSMESRLKTVEWLRNSSRIVLLHDAERAELADAMNRFRYVYVFDKIKPFTAIGSDTEDLKPIIHFLKQYRVTDE